MDQGRNIEALELFNKALDIEPDHEVCGIFSIFSIKCLNIYKYIKYYNTKSPTFTFFISEIIGIFSCFNT